MPSSTIISYKKYQYSFYIICWKFKLSVWLNKKQVQKFQNPLQQEYREKEDILYGILWGTGKRIQN